MYGFFSDVLIAGLIAVCFTGLAVGIYLVYKGLSGILKD